MLRVEIKWIDSGAQRFNGWETKEQITSHLKLSEITTVGTLMHEDDFAYYVALSSDPDSCHFFGTQIIAKPNVTSFSVLRTRRFNRGT
jgi:hypothetical protein